MEIQMTITSINNAPAFLLMCIVLCANTLTLHAQENRNEFERNIKGIQERDLVTIRKVGDSGNPAYMRHLRAILISTPEYRSRSENEAVIALVKLGDKEKTKELECSLLTNAPGRVNILGDDVFPKTKGWFAIRGYFYMLGHDREYNEEVEKHQSDIPRLANAPTFWAVNHLPQVVPHSPLPRVEGPFDPRIPKFAKQWKIWIRRNRAQLERLRPQGTRGLTFSNIGCPAEKQ